MTTPTQWFRLLADAGFAQFIRARRRDPPLAVWVGVTLLLLGGSLMPGRTQTVISYPSPIKGTIRWSNSSGQMHDYLNSSAASQGLGGGTIYANSLTPPFSAYTAVPDDASHLSAPYTITVQGADVPGVSYEVTALMVTEDGHEYLFAPVTSAAVVYDTVNNLPGPPVLLDIIECAGLIEVQFRDESNNPVAVQNATLHAYLSPNYRQAYGEYLAVSDARLVVRGGEDFNLVLETVQTLGSDPFVDLITLRDKKNYTVTVGCDQIVTIKVIVPSHSGGGGGGGPGGSWLGEISGQADMLTEHEHWFENWGGWATFVSAGSYDETGAGPMGNYRWDTVEPTCVPGCQPPLIGNPLTSSAGAFRLRNLLPSSFVDPAVGYTVWAVMCFGTGRNYETFRTPCLGSSFYNPRVMVPASMTVDLGSTFVMNPGWVEGDIYLCGFGESMGPNSGLRSLYRASDYDVNLPGIPDTRWLDGSSAVVAYGHDALGTGATMTANGGIAYVSFNGEVADSGPHAGDFLGHYRLTLAGLNQETTRWNQQQLSLIFYNLATPEDRDSYIRCFVNIHNRHFQDVEIVPGTTTVNDHQYETSAVKVNFHAASGTLFNPTVGGAGGFTGINSEGDPEDYYVGVLGEGVPNSLLTATPDAQVQLIVPRGTYTFTPTVESVHPDGNSSSHNTLPNITFSIGGCESIVITPGLVLNVDPIPQCVAQAELALSGAVTSGDASSSTAPVTSITYTLNGNTVTVCNNCGIDPTFNLSVTLADCDNTLKIMATDVIGRVSSVSKTIQFDRTPPRLVGCDDITVNILLGEVGAVVDFVVTATDNCDGAVPVTCNPPSGSFFLEGETLVVCQAVDQCGNLGTCAFTVTVSGRDVEPPTAECVPTTNPAGEHIPVAGKNPKSGHNPDGFYLLLAEDNRDAPSDLRLYVKDSFEGPCGGAFMAGPFVPGTKVKLTQSPGQASVKPMAGNVPWHINTRGEPLLVAIDTAGNESICEQCFVPPPPK